MNRKNTHYRKTIASGLCAVGLLGVPLSASAELSGNVTVVSKYVFRGLTNATENDTTTLQGEVSYSHDSGWYAGWWGSGLGYGDETQSGFENDFYAGYARETGSLSYDVGLVQYAYVDVEDADALELWANAGLGPLTVGAMYMATDVSWGNAGDIYWSVSYDTALGRGFGLSATAGFYTYNDDDAGNDKADLGTTEDSGFRHVDVTVSHAIGQTGAEAFLTYIVGGEDRTGESQADTMVLGVGYGFDL